ncbi:MAG: NAD-dependent epimerase/dehydratase family protein [bacterium]
MISQIGNLASKTFLVTGVNGFLGRAATKYLSALGAYLIGVDTVPVPDCWRKEDFLGPGTVERVIGRFEDCTLKLADLLSRRDLTETTVLHFAGLADREECEKNIPEAFYINVHLVWKVATFCMEYGIPRFIFPSSGYVYSEQLDRPAHEKDPIIVSNTYVETKVTAEALLCTLSEAFDLSCIAARLGNVYGSRSRANTVVGTIIEQLRYGQYPKVRDVTPVRDFIFIEDVIEGCLRLSMCQVNSKYSIVNLSTGVGMSVGQAVREAAMAFKIEPSGPVNEYGSSQPSYMVLDNTKLLKMTGWKPEYSFYNGMVKIKEKE